MVSESDTILDVKRKLSRELSRELPEIGVEMLQLLFGGRQLEERSRTGVDLTVSECNLHKECTVHVLKKGRLGAAPIVVPETKEPAGASRVRHGPLLRTTHAGGEEFDGSDGWAVAEDIHVAHAQDWFRTRRKEIQWDPWGGSGNKLQYFLADVPAVHYSAEVAAFLNEHLKTTQRLDATRFGSVPSCILEIDAQLRRVLVDPRLDSNPLLGSAEEGAFVLGYVQCSVMPVPLLPKRSSGALGELEAATSQRTGRGLGLHCAAAWSKVLPATPEAALLTRGCHLARGESPRRSDAGCRWCLPNVACPTAPISRRLTIQAMRWPTATSSSP